MASSFEPMMQCTFEDLRSENQHLRNLVVSLSATVLRNVTVNFYKNSPAVKSTDAEQFVREAEDCFRCAKIPGSKRKSPMAWKWRVTNSWRKL